MSKNYYKEVYLYDKWGHPVFRISIEDPGRYKETSFNAKVEEIISWSADGKNEPRESEDYLSCYIKWDSCSHFWFGDLDKDDNHNAYLHICGAQYYRNHYELMRYLYDLAFKEMGREPYDEDERHENTYTLTDTKENLSQEEEN